MATPLTYTDPKTGKKYTFKNEAEYSRWAATYEGNTAQDYGVFGDAATWQKFLDKVTREGLTGAAYSRAAADPIRYLNGTIDVKSTGNTTQGSVGARTGYTGNVMLNAANNAVANQPVGTGTTYVNPSAQPANYPGYIAPTSGGTTGSVMLNAANTAIANQPVGTGVAGGGGGATTGGTTTGGTTTGGTTTGGTTANPTIAPSSFTPTPYSLATAPNTPINYNAIGNASPGAYNDAVARSQQNIYSMAAPTMENVAAPNVNTLLNTSYAVQNPYTRGLLERGMAEGQVPWMLTAEGQQAEEQRRIGVLEQATVAPAQATMNTALTEVQKQMQKAGKLASSATTMGMMRTSEQYSADIASTMAQGTLSIYDQISQAYNEEANRQLAGATTQVEQDAAMKTAGLAAEISKYGTQVSAAVSQMQAQTEQRIAQISADVTLTGYEKETYIANIQAQTDKQVADIQGQYNMKIQELENIGAQNVAGMSIESQERIAAIEDKRDRDIAQLNSDTTLTESDKETLRTQIRTEADKDIVEVQTTSTEKIAFGWQNIALKELAQKIAEFDFTSKESSKQFWATLEEQKKLNKLTAEDKEEMRRLAWAQFDETKSQFATMTAQQNTEFQENLKLAYANLASTDEDRKGLRAIATAQLEFEAKKFWAQDKTQHEQFAQQMDFANKELQTNYQLDKMKLEASLQEQAREFDLTRTDDMKQFEDNIAWLKESKQIDVDTQKYLQKALLDSQEKQFWAKMTQDVNFFNAQLSSTESMFWGQIKWDKQKFEAALQQQIAEFDFTKTENVRQFNENLSYLVEKDRLDRKAQADLQADLITEQARQSVMTDKTERLKLHETLNMFNDQMTQQKYEFSEQMDFQRKNAQAVLEEQMRQTNMTDAFARAELHTELTMFNEQFQQQVLDNKADRKQQNDQFLKQLQFEKANAAWTLAEQARQANLADKVAWEQLAQSSARFVEEQAQFSEQMNYQWRTAGQERQYNYDVFEFNKDIAMQTLNIQKGQAESAGMVDRVNAALAFLESPAALGTTDDEMYATGRVIQDLYSGVKGKTFTEYQNEYKGVQAAELSSYSSLAPKVDMADYAKLPEAVKNMYEPSTVAGGVATLNNKGTEYNSSVVANVKSQTKEALTNISDDLIAALKRNPEGMMQVK